MSDYPDSLAAAMAKLQTELPRITKGETAKVPTKQGGSYSYTYAGLADISAEILPMLGKLGLSYLASPGYVDGHYVLVCTLLHTSGEQRDAYYPLPTSGTPQALGSAITYGRRYLLCAMTGLAPEEDDDGAAAEAEAAAQRQRPRQARTAQRAQPAEMITSGQQAKLGALMRATGITTRDAALDRVAEVTGRRVESRDELTSDEADRVIDALEPVETDDQ